MPRPRASDMGPGVGWEFGDAACRDGMGMEDDICGSGCCDDDVDDDGDDDDDVVVVECRDDTAGAPMCTNA